MGQLLDTRSGIIRRPLHDATVSAVPANVTARDRYVRDQASLALVEDDLGSEVARHTAQQLVVHQRRPGGQSQFSGFVELGGRTGRFTELIEWIRAHVSESLTVERLADRAAMSPRHFARAFTAETGTTPAKAVERFRLETARTAVESSDASFEQIAESAGFGDAGRMRRAFLRTLGLPPQALRRTARA